MRPTGKMAAAAAVALAQSYHSYQEMDCQALIEQAVRNVGGQMDYRGSNDMARNAAWLGPLENARAEGKLVPARKATQTKLSEVSRKMRPDFLNFTTAPMNILSQLGLWRYNINYLNTIKIGRLKNYLGKLIGLIKALNSKVM